ncbi:MAG: TlpA family protein disulfide reductase [Acidothermaceae bacterium]
MFGLPGRPLLSVALAIGLLAACGGNSTASSNGATNSSDVVGVTRYALASRQPVPPLAGQTLDGQSLSLQSFGAGNVVLINVWASWCGPCRSEAPLIAAAAKSFAPRGFVVLGIDEQDEQSKAKAFAASTGMTYPNLVDKEGTILRKLKMLPQMGIPSTLVIDRHGRVAARIIGPVTSTQVDQVVSELSAET